MSDTASTADPLATQARLQDVRLRILNGERVPPDEMRELLSDIRRDRENAARLGRKGTTKRKPAAAGAVNVNLDELFPTQ